MNEPHPEQQPSQRLRESLEKKLFIVHSQNQRLKSQQEQFQSTIEDYLHKIDVFNQKSLVFEQENQELKALVKGLEGKGERLQGLLKRRNEEYCQLYNYLFTEKKTTLQDTFLKEMDLNNRLNEIQHLSDNQIIEKLKATVRLKNQQLIKVSRRVEELNTALVNSSYEYQQKLLLLKEENLRLQKMANSGNVVASLAKVDDVGEYFSRKKIEGLQKEILLYREELEEMKGKLTEAKSQASSLEGKNQQLAAELEAIRSHKSSYDLSIFGTLTNIKNLEERIASEQQKNRILIDKSAELSSRRHEVDDIVRNAAQLKRKEGEISQLKMQNQMITLDLNLKTNDLKKNQENNRQLELQLASVKIVAASALDKLKRLLEFYCPYYFKREKLTLYNLTKEEQEFVLEVNVEKTLIAVKKQIDQKLKENSELRAKHSQVERTAAFQKEKITLLTQELARKNQEVKTMSETVSSLMQRKAKAMGQVIHTQEEGGRNWGYEDIGLQQNQEEGVIEESCARTRVQILENALQEMQSDRLELIDILRGRDEKLMELTAEINALRNIPSNQFKLHTFSNNSNNNQQLALHTIAEQEPIDDEKSTEAGVAEIREQLRKLSDQFKQERELLIKQYQRRQAQSISRYSTLLNNFDELSIKYTHLQSTSQPQLPTNPQQHQQMNQQPQAQPAHSAPEIPHHQSDQSAISESAIENFTDILKKYEREFNKYVAIYQMQIKKTLENVEAGSQQIGEVAENDQIERLQRLVAEYIETTKQLQCLLLEKEKAAEMQIKELENSINESKKTADDLVLRLDAANSTISELRTQVLEQRTKLNFGSEESANSTFTLLNLKNKEIDSLKRVHSKLKQSFQQQSKELSRLKDLPQPQSLYESQQLLSLRRLISQQDLLGVLEGVLQHLRD